MPNKGFKVADEPFKLDDSPVGSTACPCAGRSIGWQLGRMNDIVGRKRHASRVGVFNTPHWANTQQQKGEGPAKLEVWLWTWCSIQLRSILISRNPYGVSRLRTPGCPRELSAE